MMVKCLCVTNMTGLLDYWPVLLWSSLNIKVSCLLQKICLKEGEVWQNIFFKKNYCHTRHTRFSFFFPLPSCCISSLIKGEQSLWARGQGFGQVFMSMTLTYFHRKENTNKTNIFSLSNSPPTNCIYPATWHLTVKPGKPWTPEIFLECYCVTRKKPIGREKTKPQTKMLID